MDILLMIAALFMLAVLTPAGKAVWSFMLIALNTLYLLVRISQLLNL